jgi:phosphoribosylaminoimidazole-succinocarboxamide synthase
MKVEKLKLIYSGKAKSLYQTNQKDLLIAEFRDDTTAFNGVKREVLADKGVVNNHISAFIMEKLQEAGIRTHFQGMISHNESLVKRLQMILLENVVRNIAAGSLCKRLGITPGLELKSPLHELFFKNDALGDPMVNENHAIAFGWASAEQLKKMKEMSLAINDVLKKLFFSAGMILVDSKYEFGIGSDGEMYVGDEISPDSCRIWDAKTKEPLDKDRFRQDLGNVIPSYQKIAQRLGIDLLQKV